MAAQTIAPEAIKPRRRVAKGPKRPQYMANAEIDKVMMMFTALLAEFSAMRDRLDTYEALAAAARPITTAEVDAYVISDAEQKLREARREALLKRVFRVLLEELEEAQLALSQQDLEKVLTEDNMTLKDAVSADD
jgi:hypothetical protein